MRPSPLLAGACLCALVSLGGCGVVLDLEESYEIASAGQGGSAGSGGQGGTGKGGAGSGGAGSGGAGQAGAGQAGAGAGGAGQGGAGAGGAGAGGAGSGGAGAGGAGQGGAGSGGVAQGGGGTGGAGAGGQAGALGGSAGGAGSPGGASGGGGAAGALGKLGDPCGEPGALACNGHAQPLKLLCDGGSWKSNGICEGKTLCQTAGPSAGTCQPIAPGCEGKAPGSTFCSGADRITCGVDLTESLVSTCSSPQHCQQSQGQSCVACLPGEFACEGETLEKCAPDQGSFEQVTACVAPAKCNAGAGACIETACAADQYRCQGDELQKCRPDLGGFDKVAACLPGLCDEAGKQCDVCAPGATSCEGESLLSCSGDGQSTAKLDCAGPKPFCTPGGCVACKSASDCPAAGECGTPICSAQGACEVAPIQAGFVLPDQAPGDCKKSVCDGVGASQLVPDDSDAPPPQSSCEIKACQGGNVQTSFAPAGTPCAGGFECDGGNKCLPCTPGDKRCKGTTPEQCGANGTWIAGSPCGGSTPACSGGSCVACLIDSDCNENAACRVGSCNQASGTCSYTDRSIAETCGDGVKCVFEACDDGDKTACGTCNESCTANGNYLPLSACTEACAGQTAGEIFLSTLVGCPGAEPFVSADDACGSGWGVAPYEAWRLWRGSEVPDRDYWLSTPMPKPTGSTNNCSIPASGPSCTGSALICGGNTSCEISGCGYGSTSSQFLGGCSTTGQAGALCWRPPCADGTVEQFFPKGMVGCAGKVSFANRATLCGPGYHVCSVAEYVGRRATAIPGNHYWLDTDLDLVNNKGGSGGSGGSGGTAGVDSGCSFDTSGGTPCAGVKACNTSTTDSQGNTCSTPSGCGFADSTNQYLGGCTGGSTAGALCCADSPCADGSVDQNFTGGMVGCSGKVSFANRALLCGPGYRPATAAEWVANSDGKLPNYHYWLAEDLGYKGTDGACNVDASGTPGYTSCPAAQGPAHLCSTNSTSSGHPDPLGNTCYTVNCGYKSNAPALSFGGCSASGLASTLCIAGP